MLLAACGSRSGASHLVFQLAEARRFQLIVTPYVIDEADRNIAAMSMEFSEAWREMRARLIVMPDVFTIDRPVVFGPAKDRPILFGALAWADVFLTLDRRDFGELFDQSFYGLRVLKPGRFLEIERLIDRS